MSFPIRSYRHTANPSPDSLFIFVAIFCVLLANISLAFRFQGLIHDDAVFYSIYNREDITLWIGNVYSLFPLREAITLGLMRHLSPALARVFIVVVYIPFTILVTYSLLRRYWSINRVGAVISSTLPFLISFQIGLPLGVNISYQIVDLLVALIGLYITLYIITAQHARPLFVPLLILLFVLLSEGLVSAIIFIPVLLLMALFHPGNNVKLRIVTVLVLLLALGSIVSGEFALGRRSTNISNLDSLVPMFKVGLNSINPFFYKGFVLKVGFKVLFWISFFIGFWQCLSRSFSSDRRRFSMLLWSTAIPIWSLLVYSLTTPWAPPRYFFYFTAAAYWMAGFGFVVLSNWLYVVIIKKVIPKRFSGRHVLKWFVYTTASLLLISAAMQKGVIQNISQRHHSEAAQTLRLYFANHTLMPGSQVLLIADGFKFPHQGNPNHNIGYLQFLTNNNQLSYGIIADKNKSGELFSSGPVNTNWREHIVAGFSQKSPVYVYLAQKKKVRELGYVVAVRNTMGGMIWELWGVKERRPVLIQSGNSIKEFIQQLDNRNLKPMDVAFGRSLIKGFYKGLQE